MALQNAASQAAAPTAEPVTAAEPVVLSSNKTADKKTRNKKS
jgi:hypothetical protein